MICADPNTERDIEIMFKDRYSLMNVSINLAYQKIEKESCVVSECESRANLQNLCA